MRDIYRDGFDFTKLVPISEKNGRVIVKGVLPSSFTQIVTTDHLDEMAHCKLWTVLSISDGVATVEQGDHVVVLKAGIDGLDKDSPMHGVVDIEDIAAKLIE
tara:strand:+ start:3804 stop:4109 length:306 start_codon:yes stop_codon:yes gene_type:complete